MSIVWFFLIIYYLILIINAVCDNNVDNIIKLNKANS